MGPSLLDSVPAHIKTHESLKLNVSNIDTSSVGVFCVRPVAEGTEFGPYVGKIVPAEAAKSVDRRYSWEVFNLNTMTPTHVVDATNPKDGNWMRYVNCARFFEEQNIVSTQVGQEVYYKAMKNIEPGEELLTWYKRKRGRKRKSTTDLQDSKISFEPAIDPLDTPKAKTVTQEEAEKSSEKPKRIRKPKIIPDSYEGSFLVPKKSKPADDHLFEPLKPGQLRRRRKKIHVDSVPVGSVPENETPEIRKMEKDAENEDENLDLMDSAKTQSPSMYEELPNEDVKNKVKRGRKKSIVETELDEKFIETEEKPLKKDKTSQAMSATSHLVEINNSVSWVYPEKGQEYVFKLDNHMITQGPNGCMYTCDICSGVYKNKFSLKRHYLRNHINYKYLSRADIINCLINLQQVLEAEEDSDLLMKNMKKKVDEKGRLHNGDTDDHDNIMGGTNENSNKTTENSGDSSYGDFAEETSHFSVTDSGIVKKIDQSDAYNYDCRKNGSDNNDIIEDVDTETSNIGTDCVNMSQTNINSNTSSGKQMNSLTKIAKIKTEQQGIYRCYTCRKIFDTLVEIKDHTVKGHSEEDSANMPYRCEHCSMRFFYKQNLVRHCASHDGMVATVKKEPASPVSQTILKGDDIPRNHQCAICHQRFDSLEWLAKHQLKHKSELAKKKCPCQYCGKDFLSITNMKKHVRFHLGYRITCRYCPDVFSNVGALRKHTRVSHPEIYRAKQLDKIARHGVLRRPDKKSLDRQEESGDNQEEKVEKVGTGIRRKSSKDRILDTEEVVETAGKEVPEIKQEKFHFDHEISFAAEEIDDGGSRFKFSCTVCKKRFSNYINMCRHRRKAHSNESKPKPEDPITKTIVRKPQPVVETPEEVALFYASVSHNIATNLNEYIDGKAESLEHFRDHIKIEDYIPVSSETEKAVKPVNLTWDLYNFPPNFKPGKTISFTDIRKEFDIHSDFDSHCKSFESQSDTLFQVCKEKSGTSVNNIQLAGNSSENLGSFDKQSNSCVLSGGQISEDLKRQELKLSLAKPVHTSDSLKLQKESESTCSITDSELLSSSQGIDSSQMDLTVKKAHILLRKQAQNPHKECASPCSLGFKHIEKGEYTNFDDLLIGDIESPLVPRSQSVSSCVSYKKRNLLKKANKVHKSSNELPDIATSQTEPSTHTVDCPVFNPKSLSLLCENLLGLKRKEFRLTGSESSSSSSLESHLSGEHSVHNSSWLSTLSLAESQKENERFQSTNQIFRDIKADYSDAPNHTLDNYLDVAFGKNGQVECVCAICKKHFRDFECLIRHHWKKHPASICQFIEVEHGHDIDTLHFSEPSTVGALAVTDPGLDSVSDREIFTCTGCGAIFKTLAKLHIHIVSCTPVSPLHGVVKEEKEPKTPIKKKIQKKIKNILNGGNSLKFNVKSLAEYSNEKDIEESQPHNRVFTGCRKRTSMILPESPVKLSGIHRKSQDSVGYNPQNHVRRRELTELVDSHQCEACGIKFKTIILLERHVPNCSKKEKFKDLCPMKCPVLDESLAKLKHVCHYCQKHFTYLKSLVNHLQDFCAVKKQKVDDNKLTEEDKVKENEVFKKFKKLEEEKTVKDNSKVSDFGTRKKGWQKGMKRKPKKKGHAWTVIKKKKSVDGEVIRDGINSGMANTDEVCSAFVDDSFSNEDLEEDDSMMSFNNKQHQNDREIINPESSPDKIESDQKAAELEESKFELPKTCKFTQENVKTVDSIDEVDSGNNVHVSEKYEFCKLLKDNHDLKKTDMSVEPHTTKEKLYMRDEVSKASGSSECDDNDLQDLIKDSLAHSNKIACNRRVQNEHKIGSKDGLVCETSEVTTVKRAKAKTLLFQCISSQFTEDDKSSTNAKELEIRETESESGWRRFTNSFKKKIASSKGQYEVNKDVQNISTKLEENKVFKSFRSKQNKCLDHLSQCPTNDKQKEPCLSDCKTSCENTSSASGKNECLLQGKVNVLINDGEMNIQTSRTMEDDKDDKELCMLVEEKCLVDGIEGQGRLKTNRTENNNISSGLSDEIEMFELANSHTSSSKTNDVNTRNSLLPADEQLNSGKIHCGSYNDKLSLSSSAGLQNLVEYMETNDIKTCNEHDLRLEDNVTMQMLVKNDKSTSGSYNDSCLEAELVFNQHKKDKMLVDVKEHIYDAAKEKSVRPDIIKKPKIFSDAEKEEVSCLCNENSGTIEKNSDNDIYSSSPVKYQMEDRHVTENDHSRMVETTLSDIKEIKDTDINPNEFFHDKNMQSDTSKAQKQSHILDKEIDEEASVKLKEEVVCKDKNYSLISETDGPADAPITDINVASSESVQVYESVSEKVKRRKRNASNIEYFEYVKIGKNNKKTIKLQLAKHTQHDSKNVSLTDHAELTNIAKVTKAEVRDGKQHKSKIPTIQKSVNSKQVIGNIKSRKPKLTGASSPEQHAKGKNCTKSTPNKEYDSPVANDKCFEVVLSPSERVKMNKRQCKKESYNFGLTYKKKTNIVITRDSETSIISVSDSIDVSSLDTKHSSDVRETNEPSSFSWNDGSKSVARNVIGDKTGKTLIHGDSKKSNPKSKLQSKLPEIISEDSLPAVKTVAEFKMKCDETQEEAVIKRKPGRPKRMENSEALSVNPPYKLAKYGSKDNVSLAASKLVNAKKKTKF